MPVHPYKVSALMLLKPLCGVQEASEAHQQRIQCLQQLVLLLVQH
jgi:hypothetical protein